MGQRFSLLREEMSQRFEQVDQRFEQVDRRFDQVDQSLLEVRRDVARLQHGQEMILERMDHQEAWLSYVTGNLRAEKGRTMEDLVAVALSYGLKHPDIKPEHIRLRQKLVDTEGRVFKPGFVTEVDLIAEDSQLTVFEVKTTAKTGDVDVFALKVELVAAQNPDEQVRGVFIMLGAGADVRQRCAHYGLELVD
jgi:hypothetical protein